MEAELTPAVGFGGALHLLIERPLRHAAKCIRRPVGRMPSGMAKASSGSVSCRYVPTESGDCGILRGMAKTAPVLPRAENTGADKPKKI